jgi:hypothetical protein
MKTLPNWVIEFGEFIIILCIFISYSIKLIYNGKDTTYR